MKKAVFFLVMVAFGLKISAQTTVNDTLKFAAAKNEISTFLNLVHIAGMDSIYTGKPVTIFAPDNKAFEQIPSAWLDTLLKPANKQGLIELLSNNIISGKVTSKNLSKLVHQNNGQTILTMASGNALTAKININRNIVLVNKAGGESIVKQFDLQYGNATIFIIDSFPWVVNLR